MTTAVRQSTASAFAAAVPRETIDEDLTARRLLSADISGSGPVAADVVLRPRTEVEVATIVAVARREGIALHPRGGGWSYTKGYMPERAPSAIVDTRGVRGIEIGEGFVRAGAGVTWAELDAAVMTVDRRVPSFGPLSGIGATLGGSFAQNGGFFGGATHGPIGDTALAAEGIDGTGVRVRFTAADRVDSNAAPQPLAGDCGAFAIKTHVTLPTIPRPREAAFASFAFAEADAALGALAALAGAPHLGEAYLFDNGVHANLAKTGFGVIESATLAADLLHAGRSWTERIGGLLRTARAGKAFLTEIAWSLHLSFEGTSAEIETARAEAVRRIAVFDAEILPDAIPRVTRAKPFRPIKGLLGPEGEIWLPLHGVVPASRAIEASRAVAGVLTSHHDAMVRHGVRCVVLATLMRDRVVLEPQLFWRDALSPVHRAMATRDQVTTYANTAPNHEARAVSHETRDALIGALDDAGATHFQIGRRYAARPGVETTTLAAWRDLKRRHDPDHIMNPGALGL